MPIEAMSWSTQKRVMEIHVLAGKTSPDLRIGPLQFRVRDASNDPQDVPAAESFITTPDVRLKFTPAAAAKRPGLSTRDFSAFGIGLDRAWGEVKADATLRALSPKIFLLEVTADIGTGDP